MRQSFRCWLLLLLLATACGPRIPTAVTVTTTSPLTIWRSFVHVTGVTYRPTTADIIVEAHADPDPPPLLDDLTTLSLPASIAPVVVIGTYVSTFAARVGPWPNMPYDPQGLNLAAHQIPDQDVTTFTLVPINATGDQILLVVITFNGPTASGNISYIWRLNTRK
ncbi:MAG: hypothetical protein H0X37_08200 [Herpetosiphonaceae bacterium]|nr:hypothetical protein [Herpetosiphonaceae bacterium]